MYLEPSIIHELGFSIVFEAIDNKPTRSFVYWKPSMIHEKDFSFVFEAIDNTGNRFE